MSNGWIYGEISGGSKQDFGRDSSDVRWLRQPSIHLLHTTEGTSFPGYSNGASAPHFTIDVRNRRTRQHFSLKEGARALRPGSAAANNYGTVQYEIIYYAKYTSSMTDEELAYLAHVLNVVAKHTGIEAKSSVTFYSSSNGYGTGAKSRMSKAQFQSYEGIAGHQHVPDNTHWDPGVFPIDRLLEIMGGDKPVPPPAEHDLDDDGKWGRDTTTALQEDFGTAIDGEVWRQNLKWKGDNPGLTSGWKWGEFDPPGSPLIRAMMDWLGSDYKGDRDGIVGPIFIEGLQHRLNRMGYYTGWYDGEIDLPSLTVKGLQRAHNDGKLG